MSNKNFKILLEILHKRSNIFISLSGSKLPSREARSRVTDHYHYRPRRFFRFNSGTLLRLIRKFSGYFGRRYSSEENSEDRFGIKILGKYF